jgi:hypothetical protein
MTSPVAPNSSTAATPVPSNGGNEPPLFPRLLGSGVDFGAILRDAMGARVPMSAPVPVVPAAPAGMGVLRPAQGPQGGQTPNGPESRDDAARDDGPLDPLARHHASLRPHGALFSSPPTPPQGPETPAPAFAPPPTDATVQRAAASLEDLLPALVRRVAWSGDGRRGTMRLELGAGDLAGSTLLVHAEGGRVRVRLEVPPGIDAHGWQERIEQRLQSRGIPTDAVEIT